MWNCCNSNFVSRRCNCGCQTNGATTTGATATNTAFCVNCYNTNGVFGYFIPVSYNSNTNGCSCRNNTQRGARISCGNGTFVTVTCGRNCGCAQGNQTAQTNDNCTANTASTTLSDCYYARQYGLLSNNSCGCGF